jgi:hypothetical protein
MSAEFYKSYSEHLGGSIQGGSMPQVNSYHFDLGNSTRGPIGYCARINAETKEGAVLKLKETLTALGDIEELDITRLCFPNLQGEGEYVTIYFNREAIQKRHIDDWELVEETDKAVKS